MNELYDYPCDGAAREYHHWRARLDRSDAARAIADFETAIRTRGRYKSQYRIALSDGRARVIRSIGQVYIAPDRSMQIVGVSWDITADVALTDDLTRSKALTEARNVELESAKERIEYNSLHDFLTRLPNRMYLERALEEHAARCAAGAGEVALLQLDLDGFKQINDTLGHSAGDAMLDPHRRDDSPSPAPRRFRRPHRRRRIRRRVQRRPRHRRIRRTGPANHRRRQQAGRSTRVTNAGLGMSIGIAGASGREVDRQRLLVNADLALYRAKSFGRNRCEFYTSALQAEIVKAKRMADSIIGGLERGEFIPYFQPQVDARTLEIVGVEALARWRHPTRGVLAPVEFIPIAEELGVIAAIDRAVLEEHRWRNSAVGAPPACGRRDCRSTSRCAGCMRRACSRRCALDIAPGELSFELVKSIYLDERDERFSRTIEQIKALGIDIEIDDFGTGYASIVSLTKIRPRRLKIDRQLVIPIVHSEAQRRLVRSIVDIGRSLDIEIVAEGVETMEHARCCATWLRILQGYAFARPMAGEELEAFLRPRAQRMAS